MLSNTYLFLEFFVGGSRHDYFGAETVILVTTKQPLGPQGQHWEYWEFDHYGAEGITHFSK